MELIGCDLEFLKKHLESQFDDKMSWENYATYWQIDHILPLTYFDLTDTEQQKKCFHWSNLQPLEATENRRKDDKIIPKYTDKLKNLPTP